MDRIARLQGVLPAVALLLAACGGGSPDEGARLDPAAQRSLTDTPAPAPPDTALPGVAQAEGPAAAEGVVEGEGPESAGTPPIAPHPTRLVMLEDGLYARDAGDNWKRYENGSWVSVHAPQLPAGAQ